MKNCKSTESFCRSILAIYTNDWSIFDMFTAAMFIFFSRKFLNMCKFRTTTCPLWQAGPPGIGILLEWAIMINKLAGDGVSRLALFHAIRNFSSKWNLWFFKAFPRNYLFTWAACFLFSHFRSWDYPEHFGIYSQLDRKSKTWFFIFLNVYVSWIEWDKILMSQLSPPKSRYFADQNGPNGYPMKMNFDNSQMQKWSS